MNCARATAWTILDAGSGSLAVFPSPHKFFFAREDEINVGYVYYRKDNELLLLFRGHVA